MEKFREFVIAQGGKTDFIEDLSIRPQASYQMEVLSEKEGYITTMDTHQIGMCASLLGAGRMKKGDAIDLSAGLIMHVGLGDWVRRGDRLAALYTNKKEALIDASTLLRDAIKMSEHSVKKGRLIYGIVDKNGLHTE
jgi:pyrimidine-nucleoside phosphorylase